MGQETNKVRSTSSYTGLLGSQTHSVVLFTVSEFIIDIEALDS